MLPGRLLGVVLEAKQRANIWGVCPFSFYRVAWGIHHGNNAFLTQYIKHKLVTYQHQHFKNTSTLGEDRTAVAKAS